jgi:hypothetical protein
LGCHIRIHIVSYKPDPHRIEKLEAVDANSEDMEVREAHNGDMEALLEP